MSFFDLNFLDLLIVAVLFLYVLEGFEVGFIAGALDLLSFVVSFVAGLKFYSYIGVYLSHAFLIPVGFSNAIGFFVLAIGCEVALAMLLRRTIGKMYHRFVQKTDEGIRSKKNINVSSATIVSLNRFLGVVPGICNAFIISSFLLSVVLAVPFSSALKQAISSSKLAQPMIIATQTIEGKLNSVFGPAISDTLNFLTVKPQGDEQIALNFKTTAVSVNEDAEEAMLQAVNKERATKGLSALVFDNKLQQVAREHSRDMFARGYFSHYTPEGVSPFDRMVNARLAFTFAGENLALAPNVPLAMQGFMQSPGHKANILSESFRKIGIGAIDGGIYGIMFSQEFTD